MIGADSRQPARAVNILLVEDQRRPTHFVQKAFELGSIGNQNLLGGGWQRSLSVSPA